MGLSTCSGVNNESHIFFTFIAFIPENPKQTNYNFNYKILLNIDYFIRKFYWAMQRKDVKAACSYVLFSILIIG